jgi:hypothetical protein
MVAKCLSRPAFGTLRREGGSHVRKASSRYDSGSFAFRHVARRGCVSRARAASAPRDGDPRGALERPTGCSFCLWPMVTRSSSADRLHCGRAARRRRAGAPASSPGRSKRGGRRGLRTWCRSMGGGDGVDRKPGLAKTPTAPRTPQVSRFVDLDAFLPPSRSKSPRPLTSARSSYQLSAYWPGRRRFCVMLPLVATIVP